MKKISRLTAIILLMVLLSSIFAPINNVDAASVKLNKSSITLFIGDSTNLKVKGTDKKIKWASDDANIATVSSSGKVKGKKAGKAAITAKVDGKTLRCNVTVKNVLAVSKTSVKINCGSSTTVVVKMRANETVSWETDDTDIATCTWGDDWNGNDIDLYINAGNKAGTTYITISNKYNNETKKIKVTTVNTMKVSKSSVSIKEGEITNIKVNYKKDFTIYARSSDTSIADIDWEYIDNTCSFLCITAKEPGKTTITLSNNKTDQTIKINVTVTENIKVIIRMPSCPKTLHNYRNKDDLAQTVKITNCRYEVKKTSYSDGYKATIYFDGIKSYDYRGTSQSARAEIGWKLYRTGTSTVVDSGIVYSASITMGEGFENEYNTIYNLKEGDYTLEIISVNYV